MTIPRSAMLRNLAMGQAMMVAPPLGEDYAGKTAGSIAVLLLMLADDQDQADAAFPVLRAETLALAADVPDSAPPAAACRTLAADLAALGQTAAEAQLLTLLGAVRQWAEDHDPALSERAMAVLARWARARALAMPVLAGG